MDLRKRYGKVVAIDVISFSVGRGEIFGIVGPNGAGKSTTVECLAGLREKDGGTVSVLGLDPHRDGRKLRERIGVQLQEAALPDDVKVWEALDLYASFYRRSAGWEGLLKQWGLAPKRDTRFENLVEARHLVAALRPEILEGSSLPGALGRLARRWSEETGIPATVSVTGGESTMSQESQVTLFRAAQEALSNARRHARAERVEITLSYMEDLVALDVQDDGEGFDLWGASPAGSFGLRAMRERVEALGGSLLVESEPGLGCTLVVELPHLIGDDGIVSAGRELP
jgi:ABC-type Fe3+/spermidine/putrescine transport system ATPase subunit